MRAAADDPANEGIHSVVLTQVARAVGLGGRFDEARDILDSLANTEPAAAELLDAGGPGESPDPERLARLRDLKEDHARAG